MDLVIEHCSLSLDLHEFASFPSYTDALNKLAQLAWPEHWRFRRKSPGDEHGDVAILAHYLRGIYGRLAGTYNAAASRTDMDLSVFISGTHACFHTGLYTRNGNKAIYALFVNKWEVDSALWWAFSDFVTEESSWFEWIDTPPLPPAAVRLPHEERFSPDWRMILRYNTLLEGVPLLRQLPVSMLRSKETFCDHMQRTMHASRTMAIRDTTYVAPVLYEGSVQYAMPLYLSDRDDSDGALILKPNPERVYVGHTVVPVKDAYLMARQLGPVKAFWLNKLAGGKYGIGGGAIQRAMPGRNTVIRKNGTGVSIAMTLRLPIRLTKKRG